MVVRTEYRLRAAAARFRFRVLSDCRLLPMLTPGIRPYAQCHYSVQLCGSRGRVAAVGGAACLKYGQFYVPTKDGEYRIKKLENLD